MSAQITVSNQEAVHMVDNQDLVIYSEKFTYLSLHQGAVLTAPEGRHRINRLNSEAATGFFYLAIVNSGQVLILRRNTMFWPNLLQLPVRAVENA